MRRLALEGLRRYQYAQRPPIPRPAPAYVADDRASLLHISDAAQKGRTPIVLIPSLVNPPHILDLAPGASLARYLVDQGHDVWLIDWGAPRAQDAGMGLAGHIEQLLLPLLRALEQPPILVGYCLGGTMAIGAASALPPKALVAIATPWDFDAYPVDDKRTMTDIWDQNEKACEKLGYVPMEYLQSGFWSLDPERTIAKYAAYADMEEGSDAERGFVTVEDWANEGEPLTFGVGIDLFERFYPNNETVQGLWEVAGQSVSLDALTCPTLSIRAQQDRIVPAVAAPVLAENIDVPLGHVGMIVSSRAPDMLWAPLSQWLAQHDRT